MDVEGVALAREGSRDDAGEDLHATLGEWCGISRCLWGSLKGSQWCLPQVDGRWPTEDEDEVAPSVMSLAFSLYTAFSLAD